MRFILVLVFVLAFMQCDASAQKSRAKERRARIKTSPDKAKMMKFKVMQPCAICTEHGSVCAHPDYRPPVFKIFPAREFLFQKAVPGQPTPAPMVRQKYNSVLYPLFGKKYWAIEY